MAATFGGVEPGDPQQASWLNERLHPFGQDVGSVVPGGFAAYARISHDQHGSLTRNQAEALVPLLQSGLEPESECSFCLWEGYGFFTPAAWVQVFPSPGSPRRRSAGWMGTRLRTGRRRQPAQARPDWPRVRLPHREYLFARGPLRAVLDSPWLAAELPYQSPNIWWPADRAWCVASEIDLTWTYVGGSEELIKAILDSTELEAIPARTTDPITSG
jgi:hypothetical protein